MARRKTSRKGKTLLLPMNDANLQTLRRVLKGIYDKLYLIQDTLIVVGKVLEESALEQNAETGRVLRRHVSDALFVQQRELKFTIKQLGGDDMFSESDTVGDKGDDE